MSATARLEAAVRAAYDRCGYRRAQGTWAGGNHEVHVEVIDAALIAREEALVERGARLRAKHRGQALVCAALGRAVMLDLLSLPRARLTAEEAAERRRAELGACAALADWDEERAYLDARQEFTAPGTPTACGETFTVWSRNGKWRGRDSAHTLRVRPDWRQRVEARGCAVVRDGRALRLVLDCDEQRGDLYHVLVVLPARGFGLRTEWRWAEAASPAAQGARA